MSRDELVERMLKAYWEQDPSFSESARKGMTAAARVAVDALLGPVTREELDEHNKQGTCRNGINSVFAARRAKLERKKTPQERVTIEPASTTGDFSRVLLDGLHMVTLAHLDAERYARGLRAELAEAK